MHLEALNQGDDGRAAIVNLIDSVLLGHQARRFVRIRLKYDGVLDQNPFDLDALA